MSLSQPNTFGNGPSLSVLRYLAAGALAGVVTAALFYEMQALIARRASTKPDTAETTVIEFIRVKRESEPEIKKREIPKRPPPKEPLTIPPLDVAVPHGAPAEQGAGLEGLLPQTGLPVDILGGPGVTAGPFVGGAGDTDIVPLVRVNPQYPLTAMHRGIEGYVEVEFTIDATGAVKSARVVDGQPRGVFDGAALRAIRKWKYRPRIEDGVAVERRAVRVRLEFELED